MKRWIPYGVLIFLMALTYLALVFTVEVHSIGQAGLTPVLPDRAGKWTGADVMFCQNPECLRDFVVTELADGHRCPVCGGPMDTLSLPEKQLLPADTTLLRKRYTEPGGRSVFVTLLLSGRERASIHRPEICMTGQGYRIVNSAVFTATVPGRSPLRLMGLGLERRRSAGDGNDSVDRSFFAYWFVGKDRETPYHLQRLIWMSADRVFRNVAHRWAYVSVATRVGVASGEGQELVSEFVADFVPLLAKPAPVARVPPRQ